MTSRYRKGYAFTPNTEGVGLESLCVFQYLATLLQVILTYTDYLVVMVHNG
ncbi:MAG: hypothetical protein ACRC2S_03575 [Waterburya sp.]